MRYLGISLAIAGAFITENRQLFAEPLPPEHISAATRLVKAIKIPERTADGLRPKFKPLAVQFLDSLPKDDEFFQLSDSQREALINVYPDFHFDAALELWTPVIAQIYASHYSRSELEGFAEFYESQVGQKYIDFQELAFDDEGNVAEARLSTTFDDTEKAKLTKFLKSRQGRILKKRMPVVSNEIRATVGKKVKYEADQTKLVDTMMAAIMEIKNIDPGTGKPRPKAHRP